MKNKKGLYGLKLTFENEKIVDNKFNSEKELRQAFKKTILKLR